VAGRRRAGGSSIGELIDVVRESALDKKGEGLTVLDVSARTILADTFAIVSGRSKIQTRRRLRGWILDSHRPGQRDRARLHARAARLLQPRTIVGSGRAEGAKLVKGRRPTHHTRAARARREFLKRIGVWIFIVFFALSVAGGLIVVFGRVASR
jgi:hypothetical protein